MTRSLLPHVTISPMSAIIQILQADLTTLPVDAIVNAANTSLLGGGGVDGAIHRAAGPQLLAECRNLPESSPGVRCPTGQARITRAYNLLAKHVIHTVGPVWHGGSHNEPHLLKNCYTNSLQLAATHNLRSIAFPSISTGIYAYPLEQATQIALQTTLTFLQSHPHFEKIIFACFSPRAFDLYQSTLHRLTHP